MAEVKYGNVYCPPTDKFLNGIKTTIAANAIMEKHRGRQLAQISSWIS